MSASSGALSPSPSSHLSAERASVRRPQPRPPSMRLLIDGSNLSLRFAASPNPTLYSPDGTAPPPACSR